MRGRQDSCAPSAGIATFTGQQGCLQRRLARRKPQAAIMSTCPRTAPSSRPQPHHQSPLFPATGDEQDPDNKQLEACQRTIHPWSTVPSLINFLIKKCHAGMRYKGSRLGISHKIASLNPEVVENLCSYRCL